MLHKRKHSVTAAAFSRLLLVSLFLTANVSASELHQEDGILPNHSTEYVRTLNRNTSTDPDAAFYNPAGLAFMPKNGLHISFSSQTYYVKKSHSMDFYALQKLDSETEPVTPPHKQEWFRDCMPDEYYAELTAPVLPGIDIVWKKDNSAFFLDIAVMQAAINMTYDDGLAVMDWGNLLSMETSLENHLVQYTRNAKAVRNEMYVGLTAGGAYQFTNWISAGGGFRVIHAEGNMKIEMSNINFIVSENPASPDIAFYQPDSEDSWDIDTDTSGFGTGVILSTHFRAEPLVSLLKGLEASFRLEYYPTMELEKKTNRFIAPTLIEKSGNLNIFKDGSKGKDMEYEQGNGVDTLKVTYPTTLNFGLSYTLFDKIKLLSSAQISLQKNRDLGGREKDFNNGFQTGGGIEYFLNSKITLSAGYLYNDFGIKSDKRNEADPLLNSHTIGSGVCFHVDETVDINAGGFYQIFTPATAYSTEYVNVSEPTMSYLRKDFEETRYSVSIGITYRIVESGDEKKNNKDSNNKKPETKKNKTDVKRKK